MTEKRFIADNEYVMQNGQVYVVCGGEHSADVVATALNELISENEQLKQRIRELEQSINNLFDSEEYWEKKATERIRELEKENERLKRGKYIYGIYGGSNDRK